MNYRETMSRLNAALNHIDSAYAIVAKKHGVTFNALMTIYLMEDPKPITQKQVCEALHLPKSTVHSIVLELMKQGYISLEAGGDKREKYIVETAAGKAYVQKIFQETNRMEKNVLDALGEETCDFLVQTAEMLGNLLNKELDE